MIDPQSKIGVCAPSSYVEKDDIDLAADSLRARGYDVFVHPQTFMREHQSAGSHQQKIDAIHDLYRDESIDVIWAAGGGNRTMHSVDRLDYDLIARNPKPMIGFSDVTALLNAITVKTGIINIHAQVFKNLPQHQELDALLSGDYTMSFENARIMKAGDARGAIYGGNLSLFQYLPETLGHSFLDGAILCLEDCNEELSRIDRMFLHLKRIGALDRIGGLILGTFSDLADSTRPFGFSLDDIVREHIEGLDIPVIMDAPFGHGGHLSPLPIGAQGEMNKKSLRII